MSSKLSQNRCLHRSSPPKIFTGETPLGRRLRPQSHHFQPAIRMSTAVISHTVRQFSAQAARPISKAQSAMTSAIVASAVMLPFIPPALESVKERKQGHPNAERKHSVPLCRHP